MPITKDHNEESVSHSDDSKDSSLKNDDETHLKEVDDSVKATPSGSGTSKTDSSGKRTRSRSPVRVPALLIFMINSQYV